MAKKRKPPPKRKTPSPEVLNKGFQFPWGWFWLFVFLLFTVIIPFVRWGFCHSKCMVRHKGPYPEIACKYECPVPYGEYFTFEPSQTQP